MRWVKFLLIVTFLGGAWRLYEYNEWMSLKHYRVEAENQALERRFWDVFPARSLRFWPFFLKDSEGLEAFLESALPVAVSTRISEFGRFVTTIR